MIRSICCSKARHRNANYSLSIQTKPIECTHRNKQSKGRIQASRYTYNYTLNTCVRQTLHQTSTLNSEYLFATCIAICSIRRNKRRALNRTQQLATLFHSQFILSTPQYITYRTAKCCRSSSMIIQHIHINIRHNQLLLQRKTLALSYRSAILSNDTIPTKQQIRR